MVQQIESLPRLFRPRFFLVGRKEKLTRSRPWAPECPPAPAPRRGPSPRRKTRLQRYGSRNIASGSAIHREKHRSSANRSQERPAASGSVWPFPRCHKAEDGQGCHMHTAFLILPEPAEAAIPVPDDKSLVELRTLFKLQRDNDLCLDQVPRPHCEESETLRSSFHVSAATLDQVQTMQTMAAAGLPPAPAMIRGMCFVLGIIHGVSGFHRDRELHGEK